VFLKEGHRLIFAISIFLITLLVVACIPHSIGSSSKGPRTEDLIMNFYEWSLTYGALVAGEIDIMGFDIQESIYLDAIGNPNVVLAPVDDMGMYEFDINNNYTIPSYPGIRSPTNYKEFRQALAFLVDKDRVVEEFCDGFAARIDQPAAPPAHGWLNKSYTGANYPYEYDPAAASALLDSTGFTTGTTPNPYYDPAFPGSATTLRTYPPDHSKAGQDMDDVIFYVRSDDPRRLKAGRHLYENARKIGIPVQANEGPSAYTFDPVMGLMDYHVYTGGWNTGRPTYLYFLYNTEFHLPYNSNYVHGIEANGSPNHPELDEMLYNIYYADTFEEALRNTRNAMGLFTELCVTIPLFSARSYWAYSSDLLGVVNMDSYGFENDYLFMNAYKADGSPVRWGYYRPPHALNAMYSGWAPHDSQCLSRVYLHTSYDLPPYNIVMDQPGFVLDWFADTWNDSGVIKAKNYKKFRPDNYFVDTDGNQLTNVDVDDYLFSAYAQYAIGVDGSNWHTVQDIKYFNKVNQSFVEIFYNARSFWLYTSASPYLLPRSIWLNASYGLTENIVATYVVDTNLTTPGGLGIGPNQPNGPVWVNSITGSVSGVLTEWVDYHWELGDFVIETALVSGETVTVDYWAADDSTGYTLGDNPWEDVTIGSGMYYGTDFNPGVGGNFNARRNPYYYLETPVLGEVDFVWEDEGYYEVTIFDVVMAAGAYGSQGIAVPDDHWFPGADLAPPGGVIDIFDIVTIASAYGETFGAPPP